MAALIERMWRASLFQGRVYDDIKGDPRATLQAAIVVLIVGIALSLSDVVTGKLGLTELGKANVIEDVLNAGPFAFGFWIIDAFVAWFLGTRLFGSHATYLQLLRTSGFAGSPGVLLAVGLPVMLLLMPDESADDWVALVKLLVGVGLFVVLVVWILAVLFVDIRHTLHLSTRKALVTWAIAVTCTIVLELAVGHVIEVLVGHEGGGGH